MQEEIPVDGELEQDIITDLINLECVPIEGGADEESSKVSNATVKSTMYATSSLNYCKICNKCLWRVLLS